VAEEVAVAGNTTPAARAIVLHEGNLLVIRRVKQGRTYMVTPGGRLEPGEDAETALIRELAEETMIVVAHPRLVFIEEPNDKRWGTQSIYLCEYVSGTPQLHPDSEELAWMQRTNDIFEPIWYPVKNLPDTVYPFLSPRLGAEIKLAVENGFPDVPKRWIIAPAVLE
jgi:8-oxo-dGTP diphosphatase